jgi:hypothetical protein
MLYSRHLNQVLISLKLYQRPYRFGKKKDEMTLLREIALLKFNKA